MLFHFINVYIHIIHIIISFSSILHVSEFISKAFRAIPQCNTTTYLHRRWKRERGRVGGGGEGEGAQVDKGRLLI